MTKKAVMTYLFIFIYDFYYHRDKLLKTVAFLLWNMLCLYFFLSFYSLQHLCSTISAYELLLKIGVIFISEYWDTARRSTWRTWWLGTARWRLGGPTWSRTPASSSRAGTGCSGCAGWTACRWCSASRWSTAPHPGTSWCGSQTAPRWRPSIILTSIFWCKSPVIGGQ